MSGASNVMQERESVTDVSRVTPAQHHNIFVLKSVKNLCHVYLYRAGLSTVSAAIRSHLSCLVNTASISVTNFIPNLSLSLTSMFSDIFLKYFMTEQKKFLTDDAGDDGSGRADL